MVQEQNYERPSFRSLLMPLKCPQCNQLLGDAVREGQITTCPRCGMRVKVHYTIWDQLNDPIGMLTRDPKYVRPIFRFLFVLTIVLAATVIILFAE